MCLLHIGPVFPVVEADPAVIAVCVAVGAAHWLQVPRASYPDRPILADAAGILAAVNLNSKGDT